GVFLLRGALRLYRGPCRGTGRVFAVADDAFPAAGGRSLLRGAFPFGGVPPLRARWFNLEPFAREGMRPRNVPRARRAVAAGAADQDRAGLDRIRPEPRVDPTLAPTHAHALAQQPERGRSRGKADQREARDSRRGRPHPELPCNTRRARHGAARDDGVRTTVPTSEGKVGILGGEGQGSGRGRREAVRSGPCWSGVRRWASRRAERVRRRSDRQDPAQAQGALATVHLYPPGGEPSQAEVQRTPRVGEADRGPEVQPGIPTRGGRAANLPHRAAVSQRRQSSIETVAPRVTAAPHPDTTTSPRDAPPPFLQRALSDQ